MKLIVISCETEFPNEINIVRKMLNEGLQYFHLRKPNFNLEHYKIWLRKIGEEFWNRIVVHHSLGATYWGKILGLHGVENFDGNHFSKSCHSFDNLLDSQFVLKYLFISPVYDSISKKGYKSKFGMHDMREFLSTYSGKDVIALGGVDSSKINELKAAGFSGVAVLGAIWKSNNPVQSFKKIQEACQE